jgi:hypothetical protein
MLRDRFHSAVIAFFKRAMEPTLKLVTDIIKYADAHPSRESVGEYRSLHRQRPRETGDRRALSCVLRLCGAHATGWRGVD